MNFCKNKLIVITGTYPPEVCGVGDYTFNLFQNAESKCWKLAYFKDWSLSSLLKKIKEINKYEIDNINIQYPTMGYGKSIVPHLLCLYYSFFSRKMLSVTIHESSHLSLKAKLSTYFLFLVSNKIIFTNEFELKKVSSIFPWVKKKSTIIRIYSNIVTSNTIRKFGDRKYDVIYFGLIRPQKGIEEYLELVKHLKGYNLKFAMIGKIQSEYNHFFSDIYAEISNLNVELILDKDPNQVSEILNDSKIAYIPYPDGISERRGSAIAVIKNGCILVTTKGSHTPNIFRNFSFISDNPFLAKDVVLSLINQDNNYVDEFQTKFMKAANDFLPKSWIEVVGEYNKFLCS